MNSLINRVRFWQVVLLAAGIPFTGCGDDKGTGSEIGEYVATLTVGGVPGPGINSYTFALNGLQMVPPSSRVGTGTVQFTVSKASFAYVIELVNVFGVTRAELHLGAVGVNGARVATLYSGNPAGVFSGTLADSFIVASDIQGSTMDPVLDAIAAGQAYVVITTTEHPQGEIRGQTAPSGTANLTLGSTSVLYEIDVFGVTGITHVTLEEGPPGRAGTVRVVLYDNQDGSGLINGVLVSDVFREADVEGATIAELLENIRNSNTYINVATLDHPAGILRGQVEQRTD